MKRSTVIVAAALAALMMLQGCSSTSTSTTTVTTSVTDENGETITETKTTTDEDGEVTTEETTTVTDADGVTTTEEGFSQSEEDVDLRALWHETFYYGAEGVSKAGDTILFAYDEAGEPTFAAMMVIDKDNTLVLYDYGDMKDEGDNYVIYDIDGDSTIPFSVTDSNDDSMTLVFNDGDEAVLEYVSQDQIIEDMVSIIEEVNAN